ncbi:MAG: arginine biosynthesis protein ArgJ [Spirochaeta sp.]|nr:arginine biosynthesis protein ArgJ [Spirochaeta sp.]
MEYKSKEAYYRDLSKRAALPEGFLCSTLPIEFMPAEKPGKAKMNLSLIFLEEATKNFGACFTSNSFPGAPVLIGRKRLSGESIRGVLINNKIANVGVSGGVDDSLELLAELAGHIPCASEALLSASTGIIGWRLPVKEMKAALPELAAGLRPGSILPVAEAVMTTDTFAKIRKVNAGSGSIVGIAKGAGMIEPNLATMLVFIMTDLHVKREELRSTFSRCVSRTFNRITIDGDQSTSDMALILSSGLKGAVGAEKFEEALFSLCSKLAADIVRSGEGVAHVIHLKLVSELPEKIVLGAGKNLINSPLVKTAVYGNDPNVGRILNSLGDYLGNSGVAIDNENLSVHLGGIEIYANGGFCLDSDKEEKLSHYLKECSFEPAVKGYPQHERSVELEILLGKGGRSYEFLGADLSFEYIRENAEYRS